jgi:ABC transport system ATP-binding/permease protein
MVLSVLLDGCYPFGMPQILSCQSLSKSYSSRPLFRNITLALDDNERLGLIGPNGAGKSTLLKIMGGAVSPDDGSLVVRKGLRTAYVPQDEKFDPKSTLRAVLNAALDEYTEEHERHARVEIIATKVGLFDLDKLCGTLSGGWRKRLSIAAQLIKDPDLLLLDEPTNHLDLDGVLWLEKLLRGSAFGFVVVTHDRTFLQNVSKRIVELNAVYADGFLSVSGNYSDFLLAREQYLVAQANLEQAIASKVRREVAWLQRGARARQTKAQARIDEAGRLMDELAEVKFRNTQTAEVDIDFNASGRKTKQLLVAKHLAKKLGDKQLFRDVSFILSPGTKLGLLGTNGSGKTTLLRILNEELIEDSGSIQRAHGLRIVVFDQNRQQLDQKKSLKEALCPSGDSVVFHGRSLHVATWSKKFLFRPDQLNMPISYLSGGEQARILIANLMLQPADILILDEPTNDLDIPSLEVLEESLLEFAGALVLVTHDRYMLDNVSNIILALDGNGGSGFFANYEQWESLQQNTSSKQAQSGASAKGKLSGTAVTEDANSTAGTTTTTTNNNNNASPKSKLSTNEKRELATIEKTIEAAEQKVNDIERQLLDPAIAANHVKLQSIMDQVETAKGKVARLYERWQDLQDRAE